MDRRLDLIERDLRDHAKTLSAHNERLADLDHGVANGATKVGAIEDARRERLVEDARREEREIARDRETKDRLDRIEKSVTDIKAVGNKIIWIVVSAVIVAIVAFALKGGFTLK